MHNRCRTACAPCTQWRKTTIGGWNHDPKSTELRVLQHGEAVPDCHQLRSPTIGG